MSKNATAPIADINFKLLMDNCLNFLTQKEQDIVRRRFSIGKKKLKKETLDSIGKSYDITRERVRQIESVALKKLIRVSAGPEVQAIHDIAIKVLTENGKVMSEDNLMSEMVKNLPSATDADVASIRLTALISPRCHKQDRNQFYRPFWYLDEISVLQVKDLMKAIKKTLKQKGDVMTLAEIQKKNPSLDSNAIASVLYIDWEFCQDPKNNDWGLISWRHINPRSIKDKILIIFKETGKPLHFTEVIKHVLEGFGSKKTVTHQAIHNELIRHNDFVIVGRGKYALAEWNIPSGAVCDIIRDVFMEHSTPLKRQFIIEEVVKKRDIRIGTISLNLQKYDFFRRVGRAVYEYASELDTGSRRRRRRQME